MVRSACELARQAHQAEEKAGESSELDVRHKGAVKQHRAAARRAAGAASAANIEANRLHGASQLQASLAARAQAEEQRVIAAASTTAANAALEAVRNRMPF